MKWSIYLERQSQNKLNPSITKRHLRDIASVAVKKSSLGFHARLGKFPEPTKISEANHYRVKLLLRKLSVQSSELAEKQFQYILRAVSRRAEKRGWKVTLEQDLQDIQQEKLQEEAKNEEKKPLFRPPHLDSNMEAAVLEGIYEREPHLRIIHDSVTRYFDGAREGHSGAPSHVLLKGPPAAAKTTLFTRMKEWYEQDGVERVVFVDGPTMTKAGFENWLIELANRDGLPEIVCIEEIEKTSLDNLLVLLSIMTSGYVMKTNARIGRACARCPLTIWATCNDEELLKKFRNGALYSRFTHKLHCPRPGKEVMRKILTREVVKMNGEMAWVDSIINFVYETLPSIGKVRNDPREVIGLLDGRSRLTNNAFQNDLLTILKTEE